MEMKVGECYSHSPNSRQLNYLYSVSGWVERTSAENFDEVE